MVMDLQDVNATLEDGVARSQIKLFGSSSKPLAVDPGPSRLHSGSEEDDDDEDAMSEDEDDAEGLSGGEEEWGSDEEGSGDEDEESGEEDVDELADQGRAAPRNVHRSARGLSTGHDRKGKDVDFADSTSSAA